jgi:hypothetical protein
MKRTFEYGQMMAKSLDAPKIVQMTLAIGYTLCSAIVSAVFIICAFPAAALARLLSFVRSRPKFRLVWGSTPIINYAYWSRAMLRAGYRSETFTKGYFSQINQRSDWDRTLEDEFGWAKVFAPYPAFIAALFQYDVFFISFNGFFIGSTPVAYMQSALFRLAGKKTVVLSYGSDAYVYQRVRSTSLQHGLMISYPAAARNQRFIKKNVDYWVRNADVLIPFFMGFDGLGRWDVLTPSPLSLPLEEWSQSRKCNNANGRNGSVVVAHAPNHRGFKGTEFLIESVEALKREGLRIELKLIEGVPNSEVKRILHEEADILADQFIATGYALNSIEGMASGLPTIANLEDPDYVAPLKRWSFLSECPLVSASPETLTNTLRELVTRPELRHTLGVAGRVYVEKYHGPAAAEHLFGSVLDLLEGKVETLIDLYNPRSSKSRELC